MGIVLAPSPPAASIRTRVSWHTPDGQVTSDASVEIVDRDIMIATGAMPFLGRIVAEAERLGTWGPCTVVGDNAHDYEDPEHRRSKRISMEMGGPLAAWAMSLHGFEGVLVSMYSKLVNPHMVACEGVSWDILRYCAGDYFGEHVDVVRAHPDRRLSQRRISVVAFANGDFQGGELYFPRQGLTIVPEPGMVVLFPSGPTHPHEALPVRAGVKYSVVTWFL